jgi:hypothetical protein
MDFSKSRLLALSHSPVDGSTFVVSPQQKEVVGVLQLVGHD